MGFLLVSVGFGVLVALVTGFVMTPTAAILPFLAATGVSYFLLGRRAQRELTTGMAEVQKEIQRRQIDGAVRQLETLKRRFARWQFFAASSIDGQIGAILFMQGKPDAARPHLENAFVRMWEPQGMLAVIHAKKKDYEAVDKVLERAARYNGKQGLLWSLWAFLHWKAGHQERAINILSRGQQALGDKDPHISSNLLSLQNDKKMKMKGYGEPWYQFQLEQHPLLKQAQRGGNVRFSKR